MMATAPAVAAAPALPRGQVVMRRLDADPRQRYFLYVPASGGCNAPLLVSVHGISRNARRHVRRFARLAEQYGVVVVAPLFDKERHPGYQRLGLSGARADLALEQIVAETTRLTGADSRHFYLFGYSGGGQFAHRYAMAYPQRVAAIAIGAAGWYTFPDPQRRFPHGTAPHRKLPGLSFDAARFLRVPVCVLVGEEDTVRDSALRQCARIDAHQGVSRFERGQRWVEAMAGAARQHGLKTDYRFIALAGADHSFSRSIKSGAMDEAVFRYLFGAVPGGAATPPF